MGKQWWTVIGIYDDNEQSYIEYVEAKDKLDAKSKALRKADGPLIIAAIAPGKITDADIDGLDNVVPIRGKKHEIEVTNVRISRRRFLIPGRCPKCKKDLRRAGAMVETFLSSHHWPGHLASDGKTFAHERDFSATPVADGTFERVILACSDCKHLIWDGLHADD